MRQANTNAAPAAAPRGTRSRQPRTQEKQFESAPASTSAAHGSATSAASSATEPHGALIQIQVPAAHGSTHRYHLWSYSSPSTSSACTLSLTLIATPAAAAAAADGREEAAESDSSDSPHLGWMKLLRIPFHDASFQPQRLPDSFKSGYLARVMAGLDGRDPHYAWTVMDHPSAAESELAQAKKRTDIRLFYKGQAIFRTTLTPVHQLAAASAAAKGIAASASDSYRHYRDHSLKLLEQIMATTHSSRQSLLHQSELLSSNSTRLHLLLGEISAKVEQKSFVEEAMLAAFARIMNTKEKEVERLQAEQRVLEREISTYSLRAQFAAVPVPGASLHLAGDSSSAMRSSSHLTAAQLALFSKAVDDEVKVNEGDSGPEEDEQERTDADASDAEVKSEATASKGRKPAKGRAVAAAPAAAAASAKPSRKSKAPAASNSKKATPASKRARKGSKKDADSDSDDEVEAEAEPRPLPAKRTRKRIRSPSPIDEEDEEDDGDSDYQDAQSNGAADAEDEDDDPDAAAAIAAVAQFEAAQAAATNNGSSARRSSARSAANRPGTPHASPTSDSISQHSSASLTHSPPAAANKKRRASSPPPRVIPKRSLREILQAGAAGLSQEDEEGEQGEAAAATAAAKAGRPMVSLVDAPKAPAAIVSSHNSSIAPMDISSL